MNATSIQLALPSLALPQDRATLAAIAGVIISALLLLRIGSQSHIQLPVVGAGSNPFSVLRAQVRSVTEVRHWIMEGYAKYRSSAFQIPLFGGWIAIIASPALVEELRKQPEDVFSFREAVRMSISADHTLGPGWNDRDGPMETFVSGRLTPNLSAMFPHTVDEIKCAFEDEFGHVSSHKWTTLQPVQPFMRVVCRTSNRLFVGLPLCRVKEYVQLNVQYTINVMLSSAIIRQFPSFMQGLVGNWLTPMKGTYDRAMRIMIPHLNDRRKSIAETDAESTERPNDFLTGLLADWPETPDTEMVIQYIRLNFSAIHTTSMSFTQALYRIAAEPEKYQAPLREEIVTTVTRDGWTKVAMDKLVKLDSFLRETQRFHGLFTVSYMRVAMHDYTFADGATTIPKGTFVGVPSRAIHYDARNYDNPEEFDGFRFVRARTEGGELALTDRVVSTSPEYLPFGHGRHACPGRFWASLEIKTMIAQLLMHFEVKMEHEGLVPKDLWFGYSIVPNRSARIKLRRLSSPAV